MEEKEKKYKKMQKWPLPKRPFQSRLNSQMISPYFKPRIGDQSTAESRTSVPLADAMGCALSAARAPGHTTFTTLPSAHPLSSDWASSRTRGCHSPHGLYQVRQCTLWFGESVFMGWIFIFPTFLWFFSFSSYEIFLKPLLITSILQKALAIAKMACTDTEIKMPA